MEEEEELLSQYSVEQGPFPLQHSILLSWLLEVAALVGGLRTDTTLWLEATAPSVHAAQALWLRTEEAVVEAILLVEMGLLELV